MAPGDQRSRLLVTVTDERGRVRSGALGRWLTSAAPRRARGAVNVALVSDARVRALNRQYRRKDYATDVLSFPAREPQNTQNSQEQLQARIPKSSANSASSAVHDFLGDIVIARGVARRQARAAGHGERTEWRVLALHGLLHLLGYDHETDRGEMVRLERRLRRRAGLRSGLIERVNGGRRA
jgi:probable rRNA maturation factor